MKTIKIRTCLPGETFGRLTVLAEGLPKITPAGRLRRQVLCLCSCGKKKEVDPGSLRSNHTRSCGCLLEETTTKRSVIHGHGSKRRISKTYGTWRSMIERCTNPRSVGWHYYGGRGISVCKAWGKFSAFLRDMGERPAGHTIDRLDNDKGYFKENCKWATYRQQVANRRLRSGL